MKLSPSKLKAAVEAKILNEHQAQELWHFLKNQDQSDSSLVNLCFYLGGLITILSITFLLSPYIMQLGTWWVPLFLSLYLSLSFVSANYFRKLNYPLPQALSLIFAIGVFPLWASSLIQVIFHQGSVLSLVAIFTQENLNYLLATLCFSSLIFLFYPHPLILPTILMQIWYLIYDILPNFSISSTSILFAILSLGFVVIFNSWLKDKRYTAWIVNLASFSLWIGILLELSSFGEWLWLVFLALNIILLIFGRHQELKLFNFLGILGLIIFLSHFVHLLFLKWQLPWLLSFSILSVIGIILLRLGVYLHQKQKKISSSKSA